MTSAGASELTDHTGFWLRLVSNNVSFAFARRLESRDVTVAEWVILREMLSDTAITSPGAVANRTGLTRGAISKLMTRLIDKELVVCRESRDDRRFQEVQLTKRALTLVPQLAALADENDEAFFSVLSKSERRQLHETLQKLAFAHQIKTVPIE